MTLLNDKEIEILRFIYEIDAECKGVRARDILSNINRFGMSKQTLINKLKKLVEEGFLEHTWNTTYRPPASIYRLTEKTFEYLKGPFSILQIAKEFKEIGVKTEITCLLDKIKSKNVSYQEKVDALKILLEKHLWSICYLILSPLYFIADPKDPFRSLIISNLTFDKEERNPGILITKLIKWSFPLNIIKDLYLDILELIKDNPDFISLFKEMPKIKIRIEFEKPMEK